MDNQFLNKKIAIVIPCFNESESIETVVSSIALLKKNSADNLTAIVVNDGQTIR